MSRSSAKVTLCGEPVPPAGHICAFFDSDEQKYSTLAPFFVEALDAGDRVINAVDRAAFARHVERLQAHGVPVERAMQNGGLHLSTVEDVYHRNGALDLDGVLDMLRRALADADAEDRCVRTCGEMTWVSRAPTWLPRVLEYEALVNTIVTPECTMMCVYDKAALPATTVADIIATHSYTVINGRLRRNPNFVKPAEYLAMLRRRDADTKHGPSI